MHFGRLARRMLGIVRGLATIGRSMLAAALVAWITTPAVAQSGNATAAQPTEHSGGTLRFVGAQPPAVKSDEAVIRAYAEKPLGVITAGPTGSGTNRPASYTRPVETKIRLKATPAREPVERGAVTLASLRQIVDGSPATKQQDFNEAHTPVLEANDAPKSPISHELTSSLQFSRGTPPAGSTRAVTASRPAPARARVLAPPRAAALAALRAAAPPIGVPPVAGLPVAAAPPIAVPSGAAIPTLEPLVPIPEGAQPEAIPTSRLGPFQVLDHAEELDVVLRRSKLLRTTSDVYRTAVVDASVCDVVQFTPREVSILGKGQGATHVTFWFEDGQTAPTTLLVRVRPDPEVQQRREEQFGALEDVLAELFPESKVRLVPVADKLIVKGQARDAAEAAQILAVVRGQAVYRATIVEGRAAAPMAREETNKILPASNVINMLRIPGVHQVALRVKIAELNRSAARQFGVDINSTIQAGTGNMIVRSLLNLAAGNSTSILGEFDNKQINFGIHYLESHGVIRMLSEPTLVTLSGRPASFVAGGEFAVPTTVGVGGVGAVTTDFRAFGAIITFIPTVIDKDFVRMEVAPEFSRIDTDLTSGNGTPGLSTRAVTTTVEMRAGQTLAIAGLLDDSTNAETQGDLPLVAKIFGARAVTRNETELIILVTPELVEPMEPEAVPPLPGFDVTEPTNAEFYLMGRIEGRPTHEYRSTVWPRLQRRYRAGGPEMISGPFGHGD